MMPLDDWMYERLIDDSPEGIIVANPDGTIRYWNSSAESIFGYSADEALGQTLDLIIPEAQRQRHWTGFHQVMRTGETRYGRDLLAVPALCKSGERISIEFHVVLLRESSGPVQAIAALVRDVTARWTRDRELQQRLRALEAERGAH